MSVVLDDESVVFVAARLTRCTALDRISASAAFERL